MLIVQESYLQQSNLAAASGTLAAVSYTRFAPSAPLADSR